MRPMRLSTYAAVCIVIFAGAWIASDFEFHWGGEKANASCPPHPDFPTYDQRIDCHIANKTALALYYLQYLAALIRAIYAALPS